MEIILLIGFIWLVLGVVLLGRSGNSKGSPSKGPIITKGNGIESHYDFLEANGFITPEERKAQKDFEEDFKKNPHKYKVINFQDFINKKKN